MTVQDRAHVADWLRVEAWDARKEADDLEAYGRRRWQPN
jgi:hypothetical protein